MELSDIESDLTSVLYTEEQIHAAIAEVARRAGLPKREVYEVVHR